MEFEFQKIDIPLDESATEIMIGGIERQIPVTAVLANVGALALEQQGQRRLTDRTQEGFNGAHGLKSLPAQFRIRQMK
jgi:hypothetical protein